MSLVLWSTRHQYLRSQRSSMNKIVFLELLIKFLTRYVDKIAIAFQDAAHYFPDKKTVLVGNPRGQEVKNSQKSAILASYDLDPKKKTVLVFGGSQGALKINQAIIEAIPLFAKKDYQLLYASGDVITKKSKRRSVCRKMPFQISAFAPTSIKWQKSWRIVTC